MNLLPSLRHFLSFAVLFPGLLLTLAINAEPAPISPPIGRVVLTGATALSSLASYWTQSFGRHHPGIPVAVADPGSAAGLTALLDGTANAVLLSTPLNKDEKDRFEQRHGYPPMVIPVAMDAVAIFVNVSNPLPRISLTQLDAIYSTTRRCGAKKPIETWQALGVHGPLAGAKITPLGLDASTGAHALFRQRALCGGDYQADVQTLAGPTAVAAALKANPSAIGFASSALRAPGIRTVPVSANDHETAVQPSVSTIQTGHYPLPRHLVIVVNLPTGRSLDPALQAFVDYVRSPSGQVVAARAGYAPLPHY